MKKNNTKEEFSAEFLEHLDKSIEDILNGDKGVELDLDKLDKELDEICRINGINNHI